ncbi:DUF721 domain-containing protein [Marinilabiliaceae bacterium JC017]|nr:DUF721 domain-containing protein [Marinilabiliaceae bacterium JC017]
MRKRNVQSVGEVLKEIMKDRKLNKGLMENRAIMYWERVLGKSVARATNKIYMRNGVLYVEMNSSVIRNELMMWKDKIIANLNASIGDNIVKDIVFR